MISVGKTKFFEFMSNHGVINSSGSADLISKQDKRWLHNNNHSSQTTTLNEAVSETRKVSSLAHTEEFSLEDVSFHDTPTDCWVVIYDHVYDITPFLFEVGKYVYIHISICSLNFVLECWHICWNIS